ncbi:MAG: methyltransferase domain-containing protein [Bacteroidota bacterium]
MQECPICKHAESRPLLKWKSFTIYRCAHCGLIFADPMPSDAELMAFYQGFMFKAPTAEAIVTQTELRRVELARLFGWAGVNLRQKRFLDYGGGTGIVFHTVSELGLEAYYQDLDESAKAFTKTHFGLQPEQIIEDVTQTAQHFDYILADNVIEHVKDPIPFVQRLADKLAPGGQLVIKTPHGGNTEAFFIPAVTLRDYFRNALKYNSFFATLKAYFSRFWHCDPPRHLFSFTRKSFQCLMEQVEGARLEYEVDYYQIPPWTYSLSKQYFSKDKRLSLPVSVLVRIVLLPFVLGELLLIGVQQLLLKMRVLSPAGIILRVKRAKHV